MPLGGLTSFHSTVKIAPRMHQRSSFWPQKSKNFLGRGPPHPTPSALSASRSSRLRRSKLAPSAFDTSDSRLRRSVPPAFPVSPPDLGVLTETLPRSGYSCIGESKILWKGAKQKRTHPFPSLLSQLFLHFLKPPLSFHCINFCIIFCLLFIR